jgi:LysM repeat protein
MSSVTVRSGDTLSAIAARNGVSLAALEKANPQIANFNLIYPGQQIAIPDGFDTAPSTSKPNISSYTVQRGDTMSGIAARLGMSLGALEAANPQISNFNLIYPGQVLNVSGGSGTAPVAHPPSSGGTNAADIARKYLGWTEYKLQPSGELHMDQWPGKDVDCANFVSGCLEAAGKLPASQHNDNVTGLAANLRADGWKDVDISQAKPGDVVCFDGPDGNYQHVEIFDHWDGNTPVFIGSNNTLSDGTQAIGYDYGGKWAYRFHVLSAP